MEIRDTLQTIRDALTSTKVFSDPHEVDGVTVITASYVRGGGGGAGGSHPAGEHGQAEHDGGEEGSGGGFGMVAGPAGAYVIKDGRVSWQPAIDVNRIVLGGQILMIVLAVTAGRLLRTRMRRRRKRG